MILAQHFSAGDPGRLNTKSPVGLTELPAVPPGLFFVGRIVFPALKYWANIAPTLRAA